MRLSPPCLAVLLCAPALVAAAPAGGGPPAPPPPPPRPVRLGAPPLAAAPPAEDAWQAGQREMERDRIQEAMGHFRTALRLDPTFAQARLSLAAAHLALSEDNQ